MTVSVKERLTKARTHLVLTNPFLTTIMLRLKLVEMDAIETCATDGVSILYSPKFVSERIASNDEMCAVFAHEVLHVVLLHHTRRGTRNPIKWNFAADFVINLILQKNDFKLPGKPATLAEAMAVSQGKTKIDQHEFRYLLDPQFEGMTTEAVYERIPDPPEWFGKGGIGMVMEPEGSNGKASGAELEAAEAEAQIMVGQAALAAKQAGKLPAGLDREIQRTLEKKINWREELQKFFRRTKITDATWRRPNRRFVHQGVYLPYAQREPTGTIVVVVDTSGSISGPELDAFATEMSSIYDFVKPEELVVMYCDAAVGKVERFKPGQGDELSIRPVGGGGTDFRPPFEWLRANDIEPEAFVYLTDGYGPFPEVPAEFPVLWVINNYSVTPPWGEHLTIET